MTNEISALKKFSHQINDKYRQLLDLNGPAKMPQTQLQYFINQAINRHYLIEINLKGTTEKMVGYLSNGPRGTLLIEQPGQSITGFVHTKQIEFLRRV